MSRDSASASSRRVRRRPSNGFDLGLHGLHAFHALLGLALAFDNDRIEPCAQAAVLLDLRLDGPHVALHHGHALREALPPLHGNGTVAVEPDDLFISLAHIARGAFKFLLLFKGGPDAWSRWPIFGGDARLERLPLSDNGIEFLLPGGKARRRAR